jgi:hypothetical protein
MGLFACGMRRRRLLGLLAICAGAKHLEPGPDALEFIQRMSGEIAQYKFQPESVTPLGTV